MKLNDKIKGALYGLALGDALGLGTEFMTAEEISYYYPEGLKNFERFVRDSHRAPYSPGDWTHSTETVLVMLESLIDLGYLEMSHVAKRLNDWFKKTDLDFIPPYHLVIPAEGWTENPIVVCHRVWRDNDISEATNESNNRALIIGIVSDDNNSLIENARRIINITHDDSRCVATAALVGRIVRALIYEKKEPDYEELETLGNQIDPRVIPFLRMAKDGRLEDLHLDNEDSFWYTRKAMAAGLWGFWHIEKPEDLLLKLVNSGGSTDANASEALMLSGLKHGYDALPPLKEKIHNRERLDRLAERLTEFVEKRISGK